MNRDQIVKRLAHDLGLKRLPEDVIDDAEREGYFLDADLLPPDPADWTDRHRETWDYVVADVRHLLNRRPADAPPLERLKPRWLPRVELEARELRQALLESKLAADGARGLSRVHRFRATYLNSHPLADDDAKRLLERIDQLPDGPRRLLDGGSFFELNNYVVHAWDDVTEAVIADVVDQRSDGQARINNDEVSYGQIARRDPEWDERDLPPGMFVRMPMLAFPSVSKSIDVDAERLREMRRELHRLGDWLSQTFEWHKDQAIWFVLTDRTPFISPIEVEVYWERRYTHDRASVEVRARRVWISQETVAKAYGRAQRRLLATPNLDADAPNDHPSKNKQEPDGDARKKEPEVDNRPIPARNLEVFAFVRERMKAAGKRPAWKDLLEEWNNRQSDPDERFPNLNRLQEAYSRAEQRLEHPRYLVADDRPPKRSRTRIGRSSTTRSARI